MTAPVRTCPTCHTPLPEEARFCLRCGASTPPERGAPARTVVTAASEMAKVQAALAGRYRVEQVLGEGGMATVYLAEDIKHRRKVAVKVMHRELAATLGADRFLREIEIAAQLNHPHILPVHDSGEAGGFLFYVMPYVEGESLRERLTNHGELPVHDAVRLLVEVTDALAYAHAHGVVHRDIKPENIMLSGRHALVMDFGVAKAVSEASGRNRLTTAGVALGTPAYMAPEQASADPNLDQRVDIYALGVLGYELLAGRPPFVGGTPQQVLAAHVTTTPEPVTTHRTTVSPALGSVIMRALEKRPADRWQTADELLAQLEPLATPSGGLTPTQMRPAAPGRAALDALGPRGGRLRRDGRPGDLARLAPAAYARARQAGGGGGRSPARDLALAVAGREAPGVHEPGRRRVVGEGAAGGRRHARDRR
jgi:tRNA A-37 threonylcarbamoyl transferase component Bud32